LIAADKSLRVAEVDIRMEAREFGRPSSGRVRSLAYLLRVLLVVLLHRFREPIHRRH
jgi:hypothetical protein